MSYNNFFSRKDTLSNLKLSAVEYCVLSDMKAVIDELKNKSSNKIENGIDSNSLWPLFEDYDEKNFDDFFVSLGSEKAKQLINLFRKIKTRISVNVFETEVFLLYICIEDVFLVNLMYSDCEDEDNCFDYIEPTLDQQFKNIRKTLILKLEDFGVFV
ncbi:hypothetical protein SAMN02983004_01052 [Borreliella japonica]|uniref:Uncharacterized protein n=1 Tax=Borreliella japonica TaxID=34095 RepID=A0A1G4QCH1_BORJA|nr:P52 family lipoprotein [Borreliella japonica]SCW42145.1 hypothetical protein SAMN02983004_01052 [Borreliella japonica]